MTLVLFAISIFGNVSALRMLSAFRKRALVRQKALTKIGTMMFLALNFALIWYARDLILIVAALLCTFTVSIFTLWLSERRQIDALKKEVPQFLDRWILNMKLGHAMSAARDAALEGSTDRARTLLKPLFLQASTGPQSHLLLDSRMLGALRELGQNPHSALSRLESAREWMRKSDEFRRKSGQAVRQTSIQSAVLLFLLLALGIFMVQRYGWRRISDLVAISIALSLIGVFTMRHLAAKTRWKI